MNDEFIESFSKDDYNFYNKYPKLFPAYITHKDFTLEDLNRWFQKFNCDIDKFQLILKSLHYRVNFFKHELDFENDYPNLEKYNFVDLIDNIEYLLGVEDMPKRIEGYLIEYLK